MRDEKVTLKYLKSLIAINTMNYNQAILLIENAKKTKEALDEILRWGR